MSWSQGGRRNGRTRIRTRVNRRTTGFNLCHIMFIVNQLTFQILALQALDAIQRGIAITQPRADVSVELRTIVFCC